jgi:hypothetical protein
MRVSGEQPGQLQPAATRDVASYSCLVQGKAAQGDRDNTNQQRDETGTTSKRSTIAITTMSTLHTQGRAYAYRDEHFGRSQAGWRVGHRRSREWGL